MGRVLKSDFLVALPSLRSGAARLLDFYGAYDEYNRCDTEPEADAQAMFADWRLVGQDLEDAMSQFETSTNKS
jgi:hypothetical protein